MVEYIKIYDRVLSPAFCDALIDEFHRNTSSIQHFPGWMDQIGMCETKPKFPGLPRPYDWKDETLQLNGKILPTISNFNTNYVMWVFNILLDESFPISRDLLITKLKDKNIETRESFVPINQQKIFINGPFIPIEK